MSELAVRTRGLTKRFGAQTVVDAIDLAVPTGAVYGFLGPNGSGKTTTIRMLLGLVVPSGGGVELFGAADAGRPPHPCCRRSGRWSRVRRSTPTSRVGATCSGWTPPTAPPTRARPARRVAAALDRVGLLAAADKRYRAYSLGMRQRLAIAAALLTPKDLLVLDEPTNGLDPQGTREVRQLVGSLADDGTTVLVSSHLLSEVDQMCTHVGIMHVGRLVAQGSSAELRDRGTVEATVETEEPARAARVMAELGLTEIHTTRDRRDRRDRRRRAREGRRRLRPRRRTRRGVPGGATDPGGRLRLAHRGGLRCQRLSRSRRPAHQAWPGAHGPGSRHASCSPSSG